MNKKNQPCKLLHAGQPDSSHSEGGGDKSAKIQPEIFTFYDGSLPSLRTCSVRAHFQDCAGRNAGSLPVEVSHVKQRRTPSLSSCWSCRASALTRTTSRRDDLMAAGETNQCPSTCHTSAGFNDQTVSFKERPET